MRPIVPCDSSFTVQDAVDKAVKESGFLDTVERCSIVSHFVYNDTFREFVDGSLRDPVANGAKYMCKFREESQVLKRRIIATVRML